MNYESRYNSYLFNPRYNVIAYTLLKSLLLDYTFSNCGISLIIIQISLDFQEQFIITPTSDSLEDKIVFRVKCHCIKESIQKYLFN